MTDPKYPRSGELSSAQPSTKIDRAWVEALEASLTPGSCGTVKAEELAALCRWALERDAEAARGKRVVEAARYQRDFMGCCTTLDKALRALDREES